jgi:PleD family two-component response regulator
VTVSIGISRFSETMTIAEIFKVADEGLYEAKRLGKNRYVLGSGKVGKSHVMHRAR